MLRLPGFVLYIQVYSMRFNNSIRTLALLSLATVGVGALAQDVPYGFDNPLFQAMQDVGATKFYAPNVIVVAFNEGVPDQTKRGIIANYGLQIDRNCNSPYFVRLFVPDNLLLKRGLHSLIEQMNRDPRIRYAETDNLLLPEQWVPNDPNLSSQYYVHNTGQTGGLPDADIDGIEGWASVNMAAPPITIAVCDDGFQLNHPDLQANYWQNTAEIAGNGIDDDGNGFIDDRNGWDFSDNDSNPTNAGTNTHGIHVAGIIGMVHNNGIGGAGVARNVRIMPIRMYGGATAFMTALANGVDYAWQNGAKVISVSYNIDGYTTALRDAVGRAKTADVIYCNSAGNNSQNIDTLRGTLRNLHNNVIFVASTTANDVLSSFSNFGTTVDIAAPGSDIWSTLTGSSYGLNSGTSMATPCAAGILGSIRQAFPSLTAPQALARIKGTGDTVAALSSINGSKRANLAKALDEDSIPPSDPTGLEVCKTSSNSMKIQFLGSGDDGVVGNSSGYEVRWSNAPITAANFASANFITEAPGSAAGATINATVSGFNPGSSVHVAVRAKDNVGNLSAGISTIGPVNLATPLYLDNFEGTPLWSSTTAPTWGIVTNAPGNTSRTWADSPTGQYGNNENRILTATSPISISQNSILSFRAWMDVELTWDFLILEASTNGGTSWTRIWRFTGTQGWATYSVPMTQFVGQNVLLRFRLTTDGSVTRDGVYLDDISLVPATSVLFDNVEGAAQFTPEGTWATWSTASFSPTRSWSDSPAGNYANSSTIGLRGISNYDLSNYAQAHMSFMGNMTIDRGDRLNAIASVDNGGTWSIRNQYLGAEGAWALFSAPLPLSSAVRIGLQMSTNTSTVADGVSADDFRIVAEPWKNTASGTVNRQGLVGNSNLRPVTMNVYNVGGTTPVESYVLGLSFTQPDSALFSQNFLLGTNVDLEFVAPGFLKKRFNNLPACDADQVLTVDLINGDVNNDNEVGPGDFTLLSAAFGTSLGDAGYNAAADLNGDDEVGPADFTILSASFGQTGD